MISSVCCVSSRSPRAVVQGVKASKLPEAKAQASTKTRARCAELGKYRQFFVCSAVAWTLSLAPQRRHAIPLPQAFATTFSPSSVFGACREKRSPLRVLDVDLSSLFETELLKARPAKSDCTEDTTQR